MWYPLRTQSWFCFFTQLPDPVVRHIVKRWMAKRVPAITSLTNRLPTLPAQRVHCNDTIKDLLPTSSTSQPVNMWGRSWCDEGHQWERQNYLCGEQQYNIRGCWAHLLSIYKSRDFSKLRLPIVCQPAPSSYNDFFRLHFSSCLPGCLPSCLPGWVCRRP